jgi:hypothetical protein
MRLIPSFCLLAIVSISALFGNEPPERTRLYTTPDPACAGGFKGRITQPANPIEQILAIPSASQEKVYMGAITGSTRNEFQFTGLPPGKYDLVVIYDDAFFDGVTLSKEENTLTEEDLKKIEETLLKSEPFYPKKIINRVEGQTGRGSPAALICTFMREKKSDSMGPGHEDFKRTYKLFTFKDVGVGWQVVRARDLYPTWVKPVIVAPPKYTFTKSLSGIRVTDELKDVGDLDITK